MEENQTKNQDACCCGDSCHCGCHMSGTCKGLIAAFLVILIVFFAAETFNKIKEWKYIGQDIQVKNTITVSDTGEVYAKPDLAITSFSVVTEAKTVAEALSENTTKMNAVINAIKNLGVEEKDLKTINFNISPHYDYTDRSAVYPYYEGTRVLAGYDVTQTLQVKIRDLTKVGDIIQAAVDNGSNDASDLQFTIDKEEELTKQAREQAINNTKTKAEELASELGVKLVRITSFSENNYAPYYYGLEKASSVGMGGGDVAPQIETGENKIQVTVYITYEIE